MSNIRRELPYLTLVIAHRPLNDPEVANVRLGDRITLLNVAAQDTLKAVGQSASASDELVHTLRLERISRLEIERLVCTVLQVQEAPRKLLDFIAQRAGGSGGSAVDLVRRLVTLQIISRTAKRLSTSMDIHPKKVPGSPRNNGASSDIKPKKKGRNSFDDGPEGSESAEIHLLRELDEVCACAEPRQRNRSIFCLSFTLYAFWYLGGNGRCSAYRSPNLGDIPRN